MAITIPKQILTIIKQNKTKTERDKTMGQINIEAYFKGEILDAGLGQSSGGFPQENLSLRALEVYDSEIDSYLPADPQNNEINAWLVLIDSKDKETLNAKQLKKVSGWTGASFVELSEMNMQGVPIQFRVESRTYNDNTTLQVTWIDEVGASPVRSVSKLDKTEVMALQQRYAGVLAATKAPVAPVSATKAPAKATKTKTPTKPKTPVKPKPPVKPKAAVVGKCSADDAYVSCYSLKKDDVTDDKLNEIWLEEVGKVNSDESQISEEQWFIIKDAVIARTGKV